MTQQWYKRHGPGVQIPIGQAVKYKVKVGNKKMVRPIVECVYLYKRKYSTCILIDKNGNHVAKVNASDIIEYIPGKNQPRFIDIESIVYKEPEFLQKVFVLNIFCDFCSRVWP